MTEIERLERQIKILRETLAALIAWIAASAGSPLSRSDAGELLRRLDASHDEVEGRDVDNDDRYVGSAEYIERGADMVSDTEIVRSYHLVTVDGEERDLKSADLSVHESGALVFHREQGNITVAYAPGSWKYVEVESRDDKG